ncbi:MAG: hypothetical protein JKX75_07055 [Gammaproteobacteria bacterium]|nr:hypothetical protein [Gammaproteobacteria bacterium]
MVSDIKAAITKHDPAAQNDLYFMQYLSAVTGFVLAHQDEPGMDKKSLLGDLSSFIGQVFEQIEKENKPPEDAFGVWKPSDS